MESEVLSSDYPSKKDAPEDKDPPEGKKLPDPSEPCWFIEGYTIVIGINFQL